MARQQLPALTDPIAQTETFVHRTLLEFGLLDTFQDYSPWERIHCLHWIASSCDRSTAHEKVSLLLDALDAEEPLYRLYKSA